MNEMCFRGSSKWENLALKLFLFFLFSIPQVCVICNEIRGKQAMFTTYDILESRVDFHWYILILAQNIPTLNYRRSFIQTRWNIT